MRHLHKIIWTVFLIAAANLGLAQDSSTVSYISVGQVGDTNLDRELTSCCNVNINDEDRNNKIVKSEDPTLLKDESKGLQVEDGSAPEGGSQS